MRQEGESRKLISTSRVEEPKINTRLQSLPTDDLEFRVEVVFRSEHFRNYLSKILNKADSTCKCNTLKVE